MQSHATETIKYYDFIPFFDFQYEKIIFNCQPSHFSPCSAVPDLLFSSASPPPPVLAYLNFLWPASVTDTFLASWQRLSDHGNSTIKLCFGQCVSSAHTSQFEIREESTLSSDVEKIDVANLHLYRPLKTLLTTIENTITYHNALCFSLQNFA